jgi:hypothetical protein
MLIRCGSGLRMRQFDLPNELDKKQPFRHVTELHLNENLLQPEQVSHGAGESGKWLAENLSSRYRFYSAQ